MAHAIKARAVSIPVDGALVSRYKGADLLDAFAIDLPAAIDKTLEVLAGAAFERPAGWIRALTQMRNMLMVGFNIKTSRAIGTDAAARRPVIVYFPLSIDNFDGVGGWRGRPTSRLRGRN